MLEKIKTKITSFSAGVKKSTADMLFRPDVHLSSHLPEKSSCFSRLLREFIFREIRVSDEELQKIRNLDPNSIIVYTSKYKCNFSYLFYYTRFSKEKVPFPSMGIDHSIILWQPISHLIKILYFHLNFFLRKFSLPDPLENGHIKTQLLEGKTAFLPLLGKKSFYRRFVKSKPDPVQYLIEMQKTIDRPIYMVPELMFFSLNPKKSRLSLMDLIFGTKQRPGKLRRLAGIFKQSKNSFIEISEPLNLKEYLGQPEVARLTHCEQATALRHDLIDQLNRHTQSITGPILKSREELKENILTSDTVKSFLKAHAAEHELTLSQVHKEADTYIEEIASDYSPKLIRFFEMVLDWLFKHLFEGITIDKKGLSKVKTMSQNAPLVLVPCHKSHLDYLILSYVFKKNNMPCPHVAAGKNLSFWPLGTIFRSGGAFFMRRTFKGAELYSRIFSEYMKKLLSEGFNIEFFIEGTRSRTGKLLPPKFGLLSILVNAFRDRAFKDLLFVPVYFGYDRVLEEDAYLHEVEGGDKRPESVGQLLKARKLLKKRYGKVYVNFHAPLSLKEYIDRTEGDFFGMDREKHNRFCNDLGYKIINSINDVSIATPYGIVAGSILNNLKKSFTYERLLKDVRVYMSYMNSQNAWLSDTLAQNPVRSVDSVLNSYIRRKFIECSSECENGFRQEMVLKIHDSKRPVLDYYKNNSINIFVSAAYTSLAILELDNFNFSSADLVETYKSLREMFDNEFSYNRELSPEHLIRKDIKAFISDGIITPHATRPDRYDLNAAGYRKLKLFSRFLKTYLESYLIVINTLASNTETSLDSKALVKKAQTVGRRMFKDNEIELPEALSDINYKNGIHYFLKAGLENKEAEGTIQFYKETILNHLNQMTS